MNAAAWPPLVPTELSATAGLDVAVVAFEYRVATARALLTVYLSAVPWYCTVWSVIPAPGAAVVSTLT